MYQHYPKKIMTIVLGLALTMIGHSAMAAENVEFVSTVEAQSSTTTEQSDESNSGGEADEQLSVLAQQILEQWYDDANDTFETMTEDEPVLEDSGEAMLNDATLMTETLAGDGGALPASPDYLPVAGGGFLPGDELWVFETEVSAVPEPTTLTLLGGAALLAGYRRKHRRNTR